MTSVYLLAGWAAFQLSLAVVTALLSALVSPASRVRVGRALLVWGLLTPWWAGAIPTHAPFEPIVTVWEGEPIPVPTPATRSSPTSPPHVAVAGRVQLPAQAPTWLAGAILALGAASMARSALSARRLVRHSVPWRQIGRVEVCVSPEITVPCALRWGHRALILLDPDTFADRDARTIAVRHEAQHHRAGDAHSAWLLAAVSAFSPGNPASNWVSQVLTEAEEVLCDRALIDRGVDRDRYAASLVAVAERAVARRTPAPPWVGPSSSLLARRIHRLFAARERPSTAGALAVAVLGCFGLTSAAWAADRLVTEGRLSEEISDLIPVDRALPIVSFAGLVPDEEWSDEVPPPPSTASPRSTAPAADPPRFSKTPPRPVAGEAPHDAPPNVVSAQEPHEAQATDAASIVLVGDTTADPAPAAHITEPLLTRCGPIACKIPAPEQRDDWTLARKSGAQWVSVRLFTSGAIRRTDRDQFILRALASKVRAMDLACAVAPHVAYGRGLGGDWTEVWALAVPDGSPAQARCFPGT